MDSETNEVLCFILQALRDLTVYSHRQHGWIIALAATMEKDPALESRLKQQPFYDQGPAPSLRNIDLLTVNIDALIQRLREAAPKKS